MSTYTAVIGDARSIGASTLSRILTPETDSLAQFFPRLNPQLATARIRTIVAPHIVQDAVGGFISADFTIPAEEAQRWRPILRYGAVVWLFDGQTPIFHGWAEQPVWTTTGDCEMTVSGAWALLGRTRMREAWEQWDMTLLARGTGSAENRAGSVNIDSNGSLTLSFPSGSTLAINDRVSVDCLIFDEIIGNADGKKITAFEVDITSQVNLGASFRFRVLGGNTPSNVTDQLWDSGATTGSTGIQDSLNLDGANQVAGPWASHSGYRCLRFELITTLARTPLGNDTSITLDRVRVSTRAALFPTAGVGGLDTAALARDVVRIAAYSGTITGAGIGSLYPTDTPPEFWVSQANQGSPDTNTLVYNWGLDPVTGTGSAPNSGVITTGFTALEWQSPADIISSIAAIDGYNVGFYLPYNARGGYDPPGMSSSANSSTPDVGSWWLTAPPQLYYQPFPDPNYSPDYTIYTRQGAVVTPSADSQPLADNLYVNYQTNRGHQQSVVTQDTNTLNHIYAQGFQRSDDYTLQSAGDASTGSSLGQQQLRVRRQPYAIATITITNTGGARNPILKGGATVPKLALVRPSSMRIADISASTNIRAGYATHIEWYGQTLTSDEYIEITLSRPGIFHRQRAHGHIVHGYLRGSLTGRKLL